MKLFTIISFILLEQCLEYFCYLNGQQSVNSTHKLLARIYLELGLLSHFFLLKRYTKLLETTIILPTSGIIEISDICKSRGTCHACFI